jgi:hypothetical protein
MTFYIRLAFTSGLAVRIKGAAYFTKSKLSETDNTYHISALFWVTFQHFSNANQSQKGANSVNLVSFCHFAFRAFARGTSPPPTSTPSAFTPKPLIP